MSERAPSTATTGEPVTLETGLEALQSNPEFRGPVEPLGDHAHANDHFALIYESQEEQFAAAIPFIRQGLERGERCLYITHENSRDEVVAAMRDYDIDVDAALNSGQLSIHDEEETYLRNGTFDADETIEFLDTAIEEATEEYNALRVTGEMSSVLREDPEGEELVRCEAKANYLFDDVDGLALCQYNRNQFSADVIRDVINTHPLLIHDNRISYNTHYTPPEEYFGPQKSAREVDRLLRSLREQTDAKVELRRRERYLRKSYQITADPTRSFEAKLDSLFELSCERFGLDFGFLNRVDPDADQLEIEYASGDHEHYNVGSELPLSETYCQAAVDIKAAASIENPTEEGFDDCLVYEEFGVNGYLGTYIPVDGGDDRTLAFVPAADADMDSVSVSEADRTFLELIGQWIGYEFNRRQRERELRERTEHLSALIKTTPECIKTVAEDGTLLQMNPAGLDMVEAPEESAVTGESVYDLIVPEHRDRFREFNERICQGERGTLKFDIIGLEGTRRHMESHAVPLERPDGTTVHVALTRDITEQVEREQQLDETITELQESEERLRLALEAGEMGMWELNLQTGDVPVRSPRHDRIFGYEEPLDEWSYETFLEYVHPDDRERVKQRFEDAYETGTWDFECRITTADGEQRSISAQGEFHHDSEGEPVRAVGVVQDVTERKERERELQQQERRFEAIFEDPNILVGLLEPDGTVLDINQTAMEYIDADLDDVTDEPFWETPWWGEGDEVRSDVREWTERAAAGEYVDFEADLTRPDGQQYTLNGVFRPVTNDEGDVVSVIVSDRDITERKERERELERVERQFEAAFNNPSSFMGLLDPDGTVRRINETALEFAGIDEADVRGEQFWETPWFAHSEETQEELRTDIELAANGEYVRSEFVHQSPDGNTVTIDAMLEPVHDEDGEVVAILASGNDITERKEHAERLEQQNDRLESFASMLAHELRNPVTIGQIYSQQLPSDTHAEAVNYITEAFDRIENIIDVMLMLTRGRKAVGDPSPVELTTVAKEAWEDLDAPNAALDVNLDRTIQADETYTRHLFQNLLENAVEHGGSDVTVKVGALPDGFYVADDGDGIPSEERDAVFDQGYTTAADSGGTGLGLTFVQKFAEVYEWKLGVAESEDGGARFEFRNIS